MAPERKIELTYVDNSVAEVNWNDDNSYNVVQLPPLVTLDEARARLELYQILVNFCRSHKIKSIEVTPLP